ncbi:MAG: MerR family transcriptional regulator [Verrucomicrobiota bacterium]|nr:MerR family transcriptional regulator [Verrucomicrobiota bacterium]
MATHSIKITARMTGLSPHLIRIWEQRYNAVIPERTGTNRRLYSLKDIERLNLLRELSQRGHTIGQIAQCATEELRKLARAPTGQQVPASHPVQETLTLADSIIEECVSAIKSLDSRMLDAAYRQGVVSLGSVGLIQKVVAPLAQSIGTLWIEGTITAAHEHFATAATCAFLRNLAPPFGDTRNAPCLVVATPSGQLHELGALLVAALAVNIGWQVTYLGASLPAPEIAGAAKQSKVRAVALSLVYPDDDPGMDRELRLLRDLLPPEVVLLVGGRAMHSYRGTLDAIGALPQDDLMSLVNTLATLRKPASQKQQVKSKAGRGKSHE